MNVILGISGSISAYKGVEILRLFQKNNHQVSVVMTQAATHFIGPLTFRTFVHDRVYIELFEPHQDPLLHINLAQNNDLLLVAPATANILGKFAHGIADDLLTSLFLAFDKRIVLAPAMNSNMWKNPAVVENQQVLKARRIEIIEPESGGLACSDEGKGRLPSAEKIYQYCT